ncbi:MAG: type IV pilus secretin PilQ [Bacteriovoracaceae bacterium]|nr:type IV pilus secretin PilQ [Bacteriovoracaceae bacterium]
MKKGFFQHSLALLFLVMPFQAFSNSIKSVDFYQQGDVSYLELTLDEEAWAERFHITDDKQVILDVRGVKASETVLRGIDTSEFSGSAVFVSGYKKPGSPEDIRFAVQLRDNVRSKIIKEKNKIKLAIENRFGVFNQSELEEAEANNPIQTVNSNTVDAGINVPKSGDIEDILENLTLSGAKKYVGKKISLNVKNIGISDLLKMIADTSGFNIIIDDEVVKSAPLTLTLTNIPWDQALDTVLNLSNLVAKKNSNILTITTYDKAVKEKEQKLESEKKIAEKEPLVTKIFPISFAKLGDIGKILKEYLTPERGRITEDQRTNSLIVKDTVEVIEKMKKIVETLDTQTPQILIEAKIVEASESYSKRMGLERGLQFGYDPVSPIATSEGPGFSFNSATTPDSANLVGMSIGLFRRLKDLNFSLQLMESESKGKVISSPKIITQNKKAATITSSETTSYRVANATNAAVGGAGAGAGAGTVVGQLAVNFVQINADLNLTVTPQVTNEGSINLEVQLKKSGFGKARFADGPPDTTTRNIKTNVLVDNGSTVVIGGLYRTEESQAISGVPFLKDLPLLGWLFRTPYNPDTSRSELIIFLTPRIINQEEAGLVDRSSIVDS